MRMEILSGTARYENGGESWAWPLYASAPADVQEPLVLEIAQALDALLGEDTPEGRITRDHEPLMLNAADGSFRADGRAISPDDDATAETPEVQAALDVFYGPGRDSEYRLRWDAAQAEMEVSPEPLTDEQKNQIERHKIIAEYQTKIDAIQSGYTEQEVKTFAQKARESEIILEGLDKPTPLIDALSAGTGVDKSTIAQNIANKVQAMGAAAGEAEAAMEIKLAGLD